MRAVPTIRRIGVTFVEFGAGEKYALDQQDKEFREDMRDCHAVFIAASILCNT
jgi:hypothetical protein